MMKQRKGGMMFAEVEGKEKGMKYETRATK
jgi:hypothetical protein